MKEKIKEYVKTELAKLSNGAEEIKLEGIYTSVLEELIDGFDLAYADTNGWQGDYWLKTYDYDIEGSMYYGTATIRIKGNEVK
jgi:hypothetical protein